MTKKVIKKKTAKKKLVAKPKEPILNEKQLSEARKSDIQKTKEALDEQPKVTFLVPLGPDEKEGSFETVCINGYLIKIKKGVMVEIPRQVALLLADSYKIQMTAGSKNLISRSKKVEEALD